MPGVFINAVNGRDAGQGCRPLAVDEGSSFFASETRLQQHQAAHRQRPVHVTQVMAKA